MIDKKNLHAFFAVNIFLMLMPLFAYAADVDVKAEVNRYQLYAHYPIKGTLIISHSKAQEVDVNSATLDGVPLKIELEKEVQISPEASLVVSIYRFTIPPQSAGDHVLNPIKLKVGGTEYTTNAVNYTVSKASLPEDYEKPYLKLEAKVEANEPLFPGQRVKITYRFIYRGNVQLTKTDLPLLKPEGFKIIGEERSNKYDERDKSVQEFVLEAEAVNPGEYPFAASSIEGEAQAPGGKPLKLHSEVPPIKLVVAPFPTGSQPVTFEGAYGQFTIQDALQGASTVKVGDRLTLAIDIFGDPQQLGNVELPDLFCQPGFSGMFTIDDLSITGKIEGDRKRFTVHLRPIHDLVKEIPPIDLNYYNPTTRKYAKGVTEAIPIQVDLVKNILAGEMETSVALKTESAAQNWSALLRRVDPVQIKEAVLLAPTDIENLPFSGWYVLFLIPMGTLALAGQYYWKKKGGSL